MIMKFFIYILVFTFSLNTHARFYIQQEDSNLRTILKVLSKLYEENPASFMGARVGVEQGITNCVISQENLVADLEQNLEHDEGYCEYQTNTSLKENMSFVEAELSPRASRIIRKLRNEGHIAHISSRRLSFQNPGEDCVKKMYRFALTDGSLIWIDFL